MKAKDPPNSAGVWVVGVQGEAGDLCLLQENVFMGVGECAVYRGEEDCSHLFFECSFTGAVWASQ